MNGARVTLGIPSKGRIGQAVAELFDRAGLAVRWTGAGRRSYRGVLDGIDEIEVVASRAEQIAARLASGALPVGVTGDDLAREHGAVAAGAVRVVPLGVATARVVLAVPSAWIDVDCMADLADVALRLREREGRVLRVATPLVRLARRFLADHGLLDATVIRVHGATEAAPAAGEADVVVDVVSTGRTLADNHLRPLSDGVVLQTQAALYVRPDHALWEDAASARAALSRLVRRLEATVRAEGRYEVRPLGAEPDVAARVCGAAELDAVVEELLGDGAAQVAVYAPRLVFDASSEALARLDAAWQRRAPAQGVVEQGVADSDGGS